MKGFQKEEVFAEVLTLMKSCRIPSHPHLPHPASWWPLYGVSVTDIQRNLSFFFFLSFFKKKIKHHLIKMEIDFLLLKYIAEWDFKELLSMKIHQYNQWWVND